MKYLLPGFLPSAFKNKRLFFSLILALSFSVGISQPLSGTFTINSAQPTAGSNYQSFSEAAYSLGSGITGPVTFNVAPNSGPYQEQLTIYTIPGSSAANTVTFNCNGVTLQFSSTSSINRAGIKIDSADYIIFDSLKVTPITSGLLDFEYGYGFQLIRDADHNIIRKCTVTNSNNVLNPQNSEGIVIVSGDLEANSLGSNQCDSNIIINNTIIGGNSGITIFNFAGYTEPFSTIKGNQILNNTIRNNREAGIYLFGTENTLVQGNDIGGNVWGGTGINVSERNIDVKVNGNRIHNVSKQPSVTGSVDYQGIRVAYCRAISDKEVIISNNLIYDIRNDGSQSALSVDNSSYVNFFHNTVVLDTAGAASGATTVGFSYESTTDSSIRFQNNILYITRGGSSTKRGLYLSTAGYNFTSDYNDYYISAPSGSNIIGTLSTSYSTLTAWQSGTGKDYHSYTINPAFPNTTSNLKPTQGSLDNTGIYVNIATDIDNTTRSNTGPDVGAYEFLSSPCSTPPVAGTINAVPGLMLCAGSPILLTANGNSGGLGQTYQWQTATTETGTYTNLGPVSTTTPLDAVANTTLYYRLQVTCASVVAYSVPLRIRANTAFTAGTYTINKTQPTEGNNYNNFADVLLALKCGITAPVTFSVVPGTGPYNEQVIIPAVTGSSVTNTITFKGNGETLNFLSTNGSERAVLKLNGASNIIIDSLNVTALGTTTSHYGYGIQLINNADNNIIRNSTINIQTASGSNRYVGLAISSASDVETFGSNNLCDSNTVTGNTIIGGYWGVIVSSSTSSLISNNKFTNNTIKDFYGNGISIYGTNRTLIEGNDFSRPTRNASGTTYGVYINSVSTNLRVSKNRIHNFFDNFTTSTSTAYGIYATSSDGTAAATNIYSNNLIYNLNGLGIQYGIGNSGSDYALYYHNTISLDDVASTSTNTTQGFYQTTTAIGIQFRNNIVTITRGGTGINRGICMSTTGTTYTSDNNDFYIAGTGTNYTGTAGTNNAATLANWQTASSKDANSVAINPAYTSIATGNLKPTATTLDNKGSFVSITTDILGTTRNTSTPDIGAYEFGAPLPIKLIDITATKSGNDVLVNWSTATEINTGVFVIERSLDGNNFTTAGNVAAKGNSTTLQQYIFNDKYAANSFGVKTLYYRIKSVDKDGHTEYTKTVAVWLDGNASIIVSTFPNPFINNLYVKIAALTNDKASIRVMDVSGKTIFSQLQNVIPGSNLIELKNAAALAKGTYLVQVQISGETYLTKVIK